MLQGIVGNSTLKFSNRQVIFLGLAVCLFLDILLSSFLIAILDGFWSFTNNDNRDNRARRSRRDHEAAFHQVDNSNRQHTPPSSPAYTRIRRPVQANAIAGPSMQPGNEENRSLQGDPGASGPTPSQMEVELLIRIANGTGLSHYDTLGFLEMCTQCGYYFLRSFLGPHVASCTRS